MIWSADDGRSEVDGFWVQPFRYEPDQIRRYRSGANLKGKGSKGAIRRQLQAELRARQTGKWGDWQRLRCYPPGPFNDNSWFAEMGRGYRCIPFTVLERTLPSGVVHLACSSVSNRPIGWAELQRIKDEIGYADRQAVQIHPPFESIVNSADMFHLWVLPEGSELEVSL